MDSADQAVERLRALARLVLAASLGLAVLLAPPRSSPLGPVLALVAELPAGAVSAALEDAALRLAVADRRLGRLASVLGLRAAQRGGDVTAALAAIRVVDLDGAEMTRLAPIVERAASG
jgi:hypothetical protein